MAPPRLLREEHWTGGLPGYADAVRNFSAISLPDHLAIAFAANMRATLPEAANWISLSEGGKWAWQGHESGLIYEGLVSTGKKGFGQNSFLYVGEDLRIFTDVQTYKDTAGGWRYVDEQGHLVPYGPTYSGPPLWEYTKFADGLSIGQGPEDNDGVCVALPGDTFIRQIVPGNAHNIRVRRYGDDFVIAVVFYGEHVTRVYAVTLADLRALPPISRQAPPPVITPPIPSVPTVSTPNLLSTAQKVAAQHPDLVKANTNTAAGQLTEYIALALYAADHGWGLLSKLPGEKQYNGHAVDAVIYQPTQQVIDLMSGAGDREELANISSPTPEQIAMFDHDIRLHWLEASKRDGDNWMAPVDVATGGSQPPVVTPPVVTPPVTPSVDLGPVLAKLDALEGRVTELAGKVTELETRPMPAAGIPHGASVTVKGRIPGLMFSPKDVVWKGEVD